MGALCIKGSHEHHGCQDNGHQVAQLIPPPRRRLAQAVLHEGLLAARVQLAAICQVHQRRGVPSVLGQEVQAQRVRKAISLWGGSV